MTLVPSRFSAVVAEVNELDLDALVGLIALEPLAKPVPAASWCQRHHVIPWQDGGPTNLDNLALLCGYHHRTFEARGWTCLITNGRPWWRPPTWIDPERQPIRNTHFDPLVA